MSDDISTVGTEAELRRSLVAAISLAVTLVLLMGCADALPTAHEVPITVTSTEPTAAEQGQTLAVHIYGEGFGADGADARWERDGVPDTLIVVGEITFVSETELIASISVDRETDLGLYDVAVTRKRKKGTGSESITGVGKEIFTVEPYEPQPLGWLVESMWAGAHSGAFTINDEGMVAGNALDDSWTWTAVYWTQDGGPVSFGGEEAVALGSNQGGAIVGARGVADDLIMVTPFIYEHGVVTELEPLAAPHRSHALDINGSGTIVGWGARDYWSNPTWPLVWRRNDDGTYGAPVPLPLPNGEVWSIDQHQEGSRATAMNETGDVVGVLRYGRGLGSQSHAALWKLQPDGTYTEPLLLGGTRARAYGINDAGWVVGSIRDPEDFGSTVGVVWLPADYDNPVALGGFEAVAINGSGEIVGTRVINAGPGALLWKVDWSGNIMEAVDLLPAPDYTHARASSINADGWVVGSSSRLQPARSMATLWRPEDG